MNSVAVIADMDLQGPERERQHFPGNARAKLKSVAAEKVPDTVDTVTEAEEVRIITPASAQAVVPTPPGQDVIARRSLKHIVAGSTGERVVEAAAEKRATRGAGRGLHRVRENRLHEVFGSPKSAVGEPKVIVDEVGTDLGDPNMVADRIAQVEENVALGVREGLSRDVDWRDSVTEFDRCAARHVGDGVNAVIALEPVHIATMAARQRVVARAAFEHIVPCAAAEVIIEAAAEEGGTGVTGGKVQRCWEQLRHQVLRRPFDAIGKLEYEIGQIRPGLKQPDAVLRSVLNREEDVAFSIAND